jgi:hypothetical protein
MVFARTSDGKLAYWYWYPGIPGGAPKTQTWAAAGQVTGDPAGFATPTEQHVFYRGPSGALEHIWWDNTSHKRFHTSWGGSVVGEPVAYTFGDQQMVFARTSDGQLMYWYWYPGIAGGAPKTQIWAAAGQVTGDPAGFATPTEQHVFYRGPAGTLEHSGWNDVHHNRFHDNWGGSLSR